jgi:hypothetical protein
MNRKNLIIAVVILVLILAGGTTAYVLWGKNKNIAKFEEASKSIQNIIAEQYLPPSTMMVLALNLRDTNVHKNIDTLLSYFPGNEEIRHNIMKGFSEEMNKNLSSYALDFEKDLLPIIGNNPRIMLALAPPADGEKDPTVYGATTVQDIPGLNTLMNKLVATTIFTQELPTIVLENNEHHFYSGIKNDLFVFSNNKDALTQYLTKQDQAHSLFTDHLYTQVISNLDTPYLGYLYMNIPAFATQMKNINPETQQVFENNSVLAIQGLGLSLSPQTTGINFKGYVVGDKAVMDNMNYLFSHIPSQQPLLMKNITNSYTMLFSEVFDFKKAWEDSLAMNKTAMEEISGISALAKQYIASATGLDVEKDIFPLLDNEIAFAIQYEKGNLMPQISLLVNVSHHPDSAQKIIQLIDRSIDSLIHQLQQSGAPKTFVQKNSVTISNKPFTKVTMDIMQSIPSDMAMVPAAKSMLETTKVTLTYGITADNVLIVTTDNHLSELYGKSSMTSEKNVAEALQQVNDTTQGISYIDMENILGYVDQIVRYIDALEPMTTDDKASYDKIVHMLQPLKYIIFSSTAEDYTATTTGFIKIAP